MSYNSTGKSNIYRYIQNCGVTVFSGEASTFISNISDRTNLKPRIITPLAPYICFNRIQLRSHYIILALLHDIIRGEGLLTFSSHKKEVNL